MRSPALSSVPTPDVAGATRRTTLRRAASLLAAVLLAGCAGRPAPAPTPPRLVVFIAVDGLPMRQVTGYREQLAPDGLARFLDRGAWFAEAHYGHAYTVTAAGHATMLSGAYPHRSGIIGNEWRDLVTGERIYCTGDTDARYLGHATEPLDGTSPRNLQVETVGDVLKRANPRSKVIAVSGKDRGAILPAGHAGTAYMYMDETGGFATSSHYLARHPAWVDAYNAARPADRWFKAQWRPLLPSGAYAGSFADDPPWFGKRSGKLPMTMGAAETAPGPRFYAELMRSPFVDAMTLEFARAAIAGEQLGRDDAPDILSISLSGHDYVNHAWSAESLASHDHLLQLDRLLQDFFHDLDATVGRGRYLAVLTADHGFMPAPEHARAHGHDAGRLHGPQALERINAALTQRHGVDKLARFFSASSLVLDRALMARHGLDPATVAETARNALLAEAGIAAAYTRAELSARSRAGAPFFDQMLRSWHAERSGDVQFALKPYWMLTTLTTGTTHGSPHRYDTHVPILMWGPAWTGAGRVDQRVEVVDIAPTLARILRVAAPAGAEGRPLPLPAR